MSGVHVLRWGDEAALGLVPSAVERVVLHAGRDDRWLALHAPERFAAWASSVAQRIDHAETWVTIQGLNDWPVQAYVSTWRTFATGRLLRSLDHQLAGHVLASAAIGVAHPEAIVEVDLIRRDAYELEALLRDVLDAADAGVARGDVGPHLRRRRKEHERTSPPRSTADRVRRRLIATAVPLEQALPRALGAVYEASTASAR
jgi:hypothetical protein